MTKPRYRVTQDGHATMIHDGLQNVVANLGTDRDKAAHSVYVDPTLSPAQIAFAYRGSSLARKIINKPAREAVREWREWQAEAKQISLIEAEEKRLGVRARVLEALKLARMWGGAAIYIGTGDSDPMKPLNPDAIRKGGIRHLTVILKEHLTPGERENDAEAEGYGRPRHWTMNGVVNVHPSRLVFFHGNDVPDAGSQSQDWGESVLTTVLREIRNVDVTAANIASLVFESKVDVINIPNLSMHLSDPQGEANLTKRLMVAARAKSINGTLILDENETYTQKSASFAALPDVLDRFMQLCAGAAEMPVTELFGTSPGGLNSTGESDKRAYYDTIKSFQTLDLEPAMAVFDECLIRSALGSRPGDVHYNWRPLWQPTAQEKAETADTLGSAMQKLCQIDAVSPEAAGSALVNAYVEAGAFPGLEIAAADFPLLEVGATEGGLSVSSDACFR